MKLLIVFSMCLLAVSAMVADTSYDVLAGPIDPEEERLINSVITADYETAVAQCMDLEKKSKGSIIQDAVTRLIRGGKRNTMDFAYKLWVSKAEDIVKNYFPIQFRQMFSADKVKFINRRDNLAIKLGDATDDLKDRTAYGDVDDKTSERVGWQLQPVWDANHVYFKIFNLHRHQYLKLGTAADDAGDHVAYGSDAADTHRHNWYIKPAKMEDEMLFLICNRMYDQCMKLGRATDHAGDRQVYSHSGNVEGQPELFGWSIRPFN